MAEEGRVAVRNVRRDAMQHLEGARRQRRGRRRTRSTAPRSSVQKLTDEHTKHDRRAAEAQRSRDHGGLSSSAIGCTRTARFGRSEPLEPESRTSRAPSRSSWTATAAGPATRGLPVAEGHRAGTRALRRTVEAAIDLGVESLTVYAFSTENWTRPPDEVDALMGIFERDDRARAARPGRAGRAHALHRPPRPRARRAAARGWGDRGRDRGGTTRLNLWIAFDYGGRAELVEAARRLVEAGIDAEDVDEDALRRAALRARAARPGSRSSAPRASCASRTSCSGSSPTRSSSSSTRCGRTSARRPAQALEEYARRRRRFGGR